MSEMSDSLYDQLSAGFPGDLSQPCFITPDAVFSYGDLVDGAAAVAGALIAQGVAPGDRVALKAPKSR